MGSRDAAVLFEAYRRELSRKNRINATEMPNKKRILWLHLRPFFSNDLIRHLENELDAVIIAEEINSIYWEELDIKNPWESIAKKLINNYWVGGIEKRLRNIRKLIEEFQVDGVIHFSHWGCRQSNGGVRLIKDTVMEYGIPFLNLDGDCIDERNYSEGQYLTRLEGFMEIIG
jgi:benzoyl-CoA reductase/2-hydroxyglutaryl-CoA dehydratase subunit BcrC/BadD/HgdB